MYIYINGNTATSTNSIVLTHTVTDQDLVTDEMVSWAKISLANSILKTLESYGGLSEVNIRSLVALEATKKDDKLLAIAIEKLQNEQSIMFNKDKKEWKIWPKNFCKKCKSEIKMREMFFSNYTGCMC